MIVNAWFVLPGDIFSTPIALLKELYLCFGFNPATNEDTLYLSIDKCTFDSSNLEDVACFCNPNYQGTWKAGELIRKFNKILDFFRSNKRVPADFVLGYPTPKRKSVYTPLQVYFASIKEGLCFDKNSSINTIVSEYKILMKQNKEDLFKDISPYLNGKLFRKAVLYEIWKQVSIISTEDLRVLYPLREFPTSSKEFDVYLLQNFMFYNKNKDILFSEFKSLLNLGETEAFERLKPCVNDYFIDEVIHSEVPENYYDKRVIQTFGKDYQEAVQQSLLNNFYIGRKFNKITNTETCIEMADVKTLDLCLSYGVPSHGLTVFTVDEVYQTIKRKRTFYTPDEKKLESAAVRRLIMITSDIDKLLPLHELCVEIKKEQKLGGEFSSFVQSYQIFTKTKKTMIENTFWKVFYTGMYMRGWDGESSYPLKSGSPHETTFYEVSKLLHELMNINSEALEVPILRYENDEYIYEMCDGKKQTIKERIHHLVDFSNKISGCMRVASNWFVCTSYRYLSAISINPPSFSITDVSYFS